MTKRTRAMRRGLNLVVAGMFAAAGVVPALTHDAPEGAWVAHSEGELVTGQDSGPLDAPSVELPKGCTAKPFLTDKVLALPNDYYVPEPLVLTFDEALNAKKGTIWVVGYCR